MHTNKTSPLAQNFNRGRPARWHKLRGIQGLPMSSEKVLAWLRQAGAASPVALAAAEWAEHMGLRFLNNPLQGDFAAAYIVGSGHIVLRAGDLRHPGSRAEMVNTLVHEIRHAWQDHMGLDSRINYNDADAEPYRTALFQTVMLEADAYAHGEVAKAQVKGIAMASIAEEMADHFEDWFGIHAEFYMTEQTELTLKFLGIDNLNIFERLALLNEIDVTRIPADDKRPGIDPFRVEDRMKLGRMFGGGNYMPVLDQDWLQTYVLSAAAAHACYQPSLKNDEGVQFVRCEEIAERLKTPLKRLPLPGGSLS